MGEPSFVREWESGSPRQFTAKQLAAALGGHFQQPLACGNYTSYPASNLVGGNKSNTVGCGCSSMKTSHSGYSKRAEVVNRTQSWSTCTSEESSSVINNASSLDSPTYPPHLYANIFQEAANLKRNYEIMAGEGSRLVNMGVRPSAQEQIVVGESVWTKENKAHGSLENYETKAGGGAQMVSSGTRLSAQEHIIAERKRREKLSQRFIALSSIIPGLKKVDKASVLEDAVKYIKGLQEGMKVLQEQNAHRIVESVVLVKKFQLSGDDSSSSSDENFDESQSKKTLPQMEARISEKSILLSIHCENHKGVLVKVLSEIEKLQLTIMNFSSIPFPGSSLYITLTAQSDGEFTMTGKDLVKELDSAFKQFM